MKKHKVKYNVGSGKRNFGEGWVHVDGADFPHIQSHNITLCDVENGTIDLLFSAHLIAYFDRHEFKNLLEVWYKKIKRGGTLRIATPDFNALRLIYSMSGDFMLIAGPLFGKMPMNEEIIYHKYCYDEKTLAALLVEAGFTNVRRYDHTATEHPNTGNFDDPFDDCSAAYINETLISLNIECTRP